MLKQISRLSIALVMALVMGVATALPANAGVIISNSHTAYLTSCSQPTPLFSKKKVRLGITPTGWSNSDDLTIDLNPPISAKQIMSEIALSGFKGTQNAPKFPGDVAELKQDLETRGLTISEPWVGTYFTVGEAGKQESQRIFDEQMKFMKNFDSDIIVVAELGAAVHQQPINPLTNRPDFTDEQWQALTDGLSDIGRQASEAGMQLAYHPHIGTGVETIEDINRLMDNTTNDVKLLLDTGHLYYAIYGEDTSLTSDEVNQQIQDLTETYKNRIKHVHLKNIRESVLKCSVANGYSFLDSIRQGVFTVPGDDEGIIDFQPIFQELSDAKYKGWLVVEAEQDPNTTIQQEGKTPLDYALMARDYLCEATGL